MYFDDVFILMISGKYYVRNLLSVFKMSYIVRSVYVTLLFLCFEVSFACLQLREDQFIQCSGVQTQGSFAWFMVVSL